MVLLRGPAAQFPPLGSFGVRGLALCPSRSSIYVGTCTATYNVRRGMFGRTNGGGGEIHQGKQSCCFLLFFSSVIWCYLTQSWCPLVLHAVFSRCFLSSCPFVRSVDVGRFASSSRLFRSPPPCVSATDAERDTRERDGKLLCMVAQPKPPATSTAAQATAHHKRISPIDETGVWALRHVTMPLNSAHLSVRFCVSVMSLLHLSFSTPLVSLHIYGSSSATRKVGTF